MDSGKHLIHQFKDFFRRLHQSDLSHLRRFYAEAVRFKDPVHEIRGLVELEDYYTSMCTDLSDCRFEFLDEMIGDNAAYLKWELHFSHPRFGKRLISVRGVSHLRWSEKIEFHEDFCDMGEILHEQLPLLGNVTRWLRLRRAS